MAILLLLTVMYIGAMISLIWISILRNKIFEQQLEIIEKCSEIVIERESIFKDTFVLGRDKKGFEYIQCMNCGKKSYSRGDIENHYCGNCHKFLENQICVGVNNGKE